MPTRSRAKARTSGGKGAKRKTRSRAKIKPATRSRSQKSDTPVVEETHQFLVDEDLTPAQLRFVEELCANPLAPAVHAARIAYPRQDDATQRVTASENLTKHNIRAAIARRMAPALHKTRTSKERVLQLLGDALEADKRRIIGPDGALLPFEEWPAELARLSSGFDHEELKVGQVTVGRMLKPRFPNFFDALTMAARINKMLVDKVEIDDRSGIAERLKRAQARIAAGAK